MQRVNNRERGARAGKRGENEAEIKRGGRKRQKDIWEETPKNLDGEEGGGDGDNDLCCLLLPFLCFGRLVGSILIICPACRRYRDCLL